MLKRQDLLPIAAILAAAATRLIPHWPNFTSIGAMALFGGATFQHRRVAFLVPFAAMLLTDSILGFHSGIAFVYLAFALIVLLGFALQRKTLSRRREESHSYDAGGIPQASSVRTISKNTLRSARTPLTIGAAALLASCIFFVVSNIGSWTMFYEKTWSGLMTCYANALPFFVNTVLADLFYSVVLFGGYALVRSRISVSDAAAETEQISVASSTD